ncbi:MobF family relaxase [Miniimonas arenae]|uniref:MobF family relaxase n=1 Tax=Miniimonas arenae TaxID=676201 RepID=UPI0028B0A40B|nr:MobF family relaxase [Miniimonas arenae]
MTVSMRVMSAGNGYTYLLRSVATADGNRSLTDPLTRYYAEKGTPPGFWVGSGVPDLGAGHLTPGDEVTETQLRLLLGLGCDPVTGTPLGRAWPVYRPVAERVRDRVAALDVDLPLDVRAQAVTAIEREEQARKSRRAVAGFDFTFSAPKSVSALWAVADGGTQALIARAHRAAIADVLDLLEREVAATRVGADAGQGSVAHVEVSGVVATAYDHYDSRASDPQLHTHVVVANKVRAVHDGRWRTLAGRPLHQATVALSEHYNAVLADHLARDLGLAWERRDRGERRNPGFELAVVPQVLVEEFSSRSRDIETRTDELITAYRDRHGRSPSRRTILRLRQEATLETRPDKQVRSLAELTDAWRRRASARLGTDATAWATATLTDPAPVAVLRADDVPLDLIDQVGQQVVDVVGEKRATWRRWNLHAEASRQTMEWRFASTVDREAVVGLVVDAAERHSLRLTPPELASSPAAFRRVDGESVFRPKHATVFSAASLLDAEDRLLALSADPTGPTVPLRVVDRVARRTLPDGKRLSDEQARAVAAVAASGRVVDVLVGPAGTGKTTTMSGLRAAWERAFGPGSVVGLAPSAAAADVLADELGITPENTAKWLYDHAHAGLDLREGQLVILDEASLAGTLALSTIAQHAAAVGAKVLLAGDPAQLDAVDAGGTFGLVVRSRDDAPTLLDVRRFHAEWERRASLRLRLGDPQVLGAYEAHERIVAGEHEAMLDALYEAWRADLTAGLASLMIAETHDAVAELNGRARLDRIRAGLVDPTGAMRLVDGAEAGVGDLVLTRANDRRLVVGLGFVKNGDRWQVVQAHRDGSLTVRQDARRGGQVRLPAWYVAEHLDLAYAATVHQAQGLTVDTAHALVDATRTTREALYVAMTRGRARNVAYVGLDIPGLEEHLQPAEPPSGRSVLTAVLTRVGAEPSAHETIAAEQDTWAGIAQLAAEYETIAAHATQHRYLDLFARAGLTDTQVDELVAADSFGPLLAELRRLAASRHDLPTLLADVVAARPLQDAEDLGAVLCWRLQHLSVATGGARVRTAERMIAGLIPEAVAPIDPETRQALDERRDLIEQRATTLARAALDEQAPWLRAVGAPPADPRRAAAWLRQVRVVAAYRDRYHLTDDTPLGPTAESLTQRVDQARAEAAIDAARRIATEPVSASPPRHAPAARSARRAAGPAL